MIFLYAYLGMLLVGVLHSEFSVIPALSYIVTLAGFALVALVRGK